MTRTWLAELFSQHRKSRVPPQRLWSNNIFPERVTLTCRKKNEKKRLYKFLQVTKWGGVSGLSERQGVAAKREEKKKKNRSYNAVTTLHWLAADLQYKTNRQLLHLANTGVSHKQKRRTNYVASKPPTQEPVCLKANKYLSPNPFEQFWWMTQYAAAVGKLEICQNGSQIP